MPDSAEIVSGYPDAKQPSLIRGQEFLQEKFTLEDKVCHCMRKKTK
jgi:hypothetical protein